MTKKETKSLGQKIEHDYKTNMFESSSGSKEDWLDLTAYLSVCPEVEFKDFRTHPAMLRTVEGTNYISLCENLKFFKINPNHLITSKLKKFSSTDELYRPPRKLTFSAQGQKISMSPTSMRYAKNWANIIDIFQIDQLKQLNIVEIGSGYGGEAKIFFDINLNFPNEFDYEVYDLPSSQKLIKRFLEHFNYNVTMREVSELEKSSEKIFSKTTLVISNAALSEMYGDLLAEYLEKIILKADYGYFICNFDTHSYGNPGGMTNQQFFDYLKNNGKNPTILPANLFLTPSSKKTSQLIVFGANQKVIEDIIHHRKSMFFLGATLKGALVETIFRLSKFFKN